MTINTGSVLVAGSDYPRAWSSIVLLSMIFFVASYATGLGNVPWQQGELFSLEVRGLGTSLATASNWSANLLINSTYLSLMAKITPAGAFGFYAGLCVLGYIFVVFCFPELAGLSLEEVTAVFRGGQKGGNGKTGSFWMTIKEGERLRKVKKEIQEREKAKGTMG
jgi:SP family myo-inositol transporter-like MFS transporter 13